MQNLKQENGSDGDHGSKVGGSFFIASDHAPELLKTIGESFNDIPLWVVLFVERTSALLRRALVQRIWQR